MGITTTIMPPPARNNPGAGPRPRWQSWLARFGLAAGVPLVFFGLLELGLRLGGFGVNLDFFIPDGQPGIYRTNPRFTELFFPASFGLKPVNFRLPKEKPAGSLRVFVLGESAAMGVPEPAFGLAPQLQAQLRAAFPGRVTDVYNLGVTAINSHAVLRIARQAAEFQPDLFVVYLGNNEVVGPYGPSSVVTGAVLPAWLVRTGLEVRASRTGQLVQRGLAALRPAGGFTDWRGMEMFAGKTVAAADPRLAAVRANFEKNLSDLLAVAREHGIKTVLCTVAVNVRDCAPFASLPSAPGGHLAAAALASDLGDTGEARAQLEAALQSNPGHADTHFQLARVLEGAGDQAAARRHSFAALEQDALRFRADESINAIIRRVAVGGVTLVDAAKALGADPDSSGAPAGRDLFFEHVHLRWEGNFALARLVAPAAWTLLAGGQTPPRAWLDAQACAEAVGFGPIGQLAMARSMETLTNRPPFTGQSTYGEDRSRLLGEIARIEAVLAEPAAAAAALAGVEAALARDPENPDLLFQTAAARLQSGKFSAVEELGARLIAAAPFSPEFAAQQAFVLQRLGRFDGGNKLLRHSLGAFPYYFQSYSLLAQLWAESGQLPEMLGQFAHWVNRMPDSRALRSTYAWMLARSGDAVAAEAQWRAILRMVPDDESAMAPLLKRLQEQGKTDEMVTLMETAAAYNPRNFDNNTRLVQVYENRSDTARLVTALQALAASGPVNPLLYRDLALALRQLGREPEAQAALHRGLRALAKEDDPALRHELTRLLP
jgi:tetratricopeptide (TPR) repeat protein